MILKKYDKLEANKNRCFPMSFGKCFVLILLCIFLLLLVVFFSPFLNIYIEGLLNFLVIFVIMIGVPVVGTMIYFNSIKWFSTALIVKDKKLYLVQLINYDLFQKKYADVNLVFPTIYSDECYIKMLNDWLDEKEIEGKVIFLDKISVVTEKNKYYRCVYEKACKKNFIKIPKAYSNFYDLIKEVQNG